MEMYANPEREEADSPLYNFKGTIEGFGDTKDMIHLTEKILRRFIPIVGKTVQYTESDREIVVEEYYCYAKKGFKTSGNNVIIHEDAGSSLRCAIDCLGRPSFLIVMSKKVEENSPSFYTNIGHNGTYVDLHGEMFKLPTAVDVDNLPRYVFKGLQDKPKKQVIVEVELPEIEEEVMEEREELFPDIDTAVELVKVEDAHDFDPNKSFTVKDYGYFTSEHESETAGSNDTEAHQESDDLTETES